MSDSPLFRIGQPFQSGWDRVPDTKDVRPDFNYVECDVPVGMTLTEWRGPKVAKRRWWR